MSEMRGSVISNRKIVNTADTDTLKSASEESVGQSCNCFGRRISFLLFLYRLIWSMFYNLFRGVLWQYVWAFKTLKQLRSCHNKQRGCPSEMHIDSDMHSETTVGHNIAPHEMINENSWLLIEKPDNNNNTDLYVSGEISDENGFFGTCVEFEECDGFQDDDYHDILRLHAEMDPLELVLEPHEIDWEAPIGSPLVYTDEDQDSELSHGSLQEMFIEDDYVVILETESLSDITDVENVDASLDHSCVSEKDCLSNEEFWMPPRLEGVLENEEYVFPIYDEDVLVAITGVQQRNKARTDEQDPPRLPETR